MEKLIVESMNVNYVDAEQYPSSTEIQNRCVSAVCAEAHSLCQQANTWCMCSVHTISTMLIGTACSRLPDCVCCRCCQFSTGMWNDIYKSMLHLLV